MSGKIVMSHAQVFLSVFFPAIVFPTGLHETMVGQSWLVITADTQSEMWHYFPSRDKTRPFFLRCFKPTKTERANTCNSMPGV